MFCLLSETRFGGKEATKKTPKTNIKQHMKYSALTQSLLTYLNKLQKIVSRLAILGVVITQKDLNSKFLRSLPPKWNTHVETMDDLYNNFKIVEQSVKKSVGASSGAQNLAFMTALSTSSTNDVNTAKHAYEVSTVSPNDLEQIHEDDLEAMDLKWQLSLLSMRAKRYFQRTGKKIFINANDTAGYDKSKVECFNCHKMRHFARECRAPRNKEDQFRNQDNTRKHGNNEDTSSKAMLAIDGVGFDWSEMAKEQVQTNMDLMAFLDSEVYNDKTCSKTCLKNYETLKKQCDDLIVKLNQTEFTAATYKRGLATVEEQLITYRKNEVLFSEEVAVLKREVACKDYEINVLKSKFEKVKQEKEGIEFKIEKFDKASKDLDKLLGSQITDKSKKGLGYNVVPPPHPLIYNRPKKLDLSYSGLDEFKEPEFKAYGSEVSKQESNVVCDKKSDDSKENSDDSLVKEQVSKDTSSFVESPLNVDKETIFLDKKIEIVKPKNHEITVKKSVRYAEMYRSQSPRGNQRNWNGQKSNQLGSNFVMSNKGCFICGSFDHVHAHCKYHQRERMVYGNNYNRMNNNHTTNRTYPNAQRNMVPRAVLMKTSPKPFNFARTVNTAHPKSTVFSATSMSRFSKSAQSTAKAVNTARPKAVNTARPHSAVVNTVWFNQENAVKALSKPQQDDTRFIDNRCSRHMSGNIAYLSDFKEFDGGYVTFGGGAHGGRISSKGTLKTDSLDFEDVYFVNELKFNLFSVSQMCDKKNYVLFTDTECLVLSPNFKLPDETHILLKIPRKDNMYSFDMKNIVPKESLTCLIAKATLDESMLWHRRLGHINFKNINKLVKDNLVRGFPTKHFKNDQTCVSCLKGKQHRASCKSKVLNPITKPLFMLYMDLFGPTFVSSLMHKKYCLVVTDDYSKFTWVLFLATKDETNEILKNFIKEIENLVDKKVKIIRCDNRTEFKNKVMDNFCREKGIRREYSVARTPQQNGVAERRNRTLIEAARTIGLKPALNFMRPFGCHVTILNTLDNLGKFDGKSDEGFFVGYSLRSKAFRVYNTRTKRVEENFHIGFLENKPMIEGNGPKWLFDIDSLAQSMNYVPVAAGTITNESAGTQGELNASTSTQKEEISQDCIHVEDGPDNENDEKYKSKDDSSPKEVNAARQHVNTANLEVNNGRFKLNTVDPSISTNSSNDQDSPKDMFKLGASHTLEITHVEFFSDEDEPEVDLGNITNSYTVEAMQEEILQFKLQQGHRQEEGIDYEEVFALVARIEAIRLFLVYASFMDFLVYQMDVKSAFLYGTIEEEVYVTQPPGFKDPDNPNKVYKVVKALYGLHRAPRAWYETLANYLLGNGFKRGKIDQTLFTKKQKGDILLVQVYVNDIIFGSTNKELCTGFKKLIKDKFQMSSIGELTFFLGLQVQQKEDGIFISRDKYVDEILKKFNYTNVKSASTPVDLEKPLVKDGDANDVDVHIYRSMIGSLMY
ncbi:putative ribonuclease H-like domain-containing protein, partial [Tanacetum coccineum]